MTERDTRADDVTLLLEGIEAGDRAAQDRLLELVYDRLRGMARARMRGQGPGHTLQPTALVHEAWMKLVKGQPSLADRSHFFAVAALAMRQILVNHAERKAAAKRGGDAHRVTFDEMAVHAETPDVDVLALNRAVDALEAESPRLARLVQLRYFAGLTIDETAEVLEISAATVKRDWAYARAWLFERMEADTGSR